MNKVKQMLRIKIALLTIALALLSFMSSHAQVALPSTYGGNWATLPVLGTWSGWHQNSTTNNATNCGDAAGGAAVFNAVGDWVGVYFNAQAGPVQFNAYYITNNANRITVEESPDGIAWSVLMGPTLTITCGAFTTPCPLANTRYIRFRCSSFGGTGTVRLDAITVPSGGVPVVNLSSTDVTPAQGQCINFTDLSTGAPTSWTWNFGGGTPASSTSQNPTSICYNTIGTYSVSLLVSNACGSSASAVITNFITVSAPNCTDGVQNQGETCVDGGGPCAACPIAPPPNTCGSGAGNLCVFSNYDGSGATAATRLNIDVDVNVPNLKIGICSYERLSVNITGAQLACLTAVHYAGFNATNNHCASTATTNITGGPAATYAYIPAGVINDGGNSSIICAYQCVSGYNGGCNTAKEVVAYFVNYFGAGTSLRSHVVQYGCWAGATKLISNTGSTCCLGVLPIKLNYFRGYSTGPNVVLEWETSSEKNNQHFTIEKSRDGNTFEPLRSSKGAGNSEEKIKYIMLDDKPFAGKSFYRLSQTDFDGTSSTLEMISMEHFSESYKTLSIEKVFNENKLRIYLPEKEETQSEIKIEIVDLYGRRFVSNSIDANNNKELYYDYEALSHGIYMATLSLNDEFLSTIKIIKE